MPDPTDPAAEEAVADAEGILDAATIAMLYDLELDPTVPNAPVEVGPLMGYLLVCACQLTRTHPGIGPQLAGMYEELGRKLQALFGGPAFELLERGWDRSQDRPPTEEGTPDD